MGGKQKRAAKMKRWAAAHNQNQEESKKPFDTKHMKDDDSSELEYQPIPYEIQQEIVKRRMKKMKEDKLRPPGSRRISRIIDVLERVPNWLFTFTVFLVLYIVGFFLFRFLIQVFVAEKTQVNRSALFASLQNVFPKPLYKLVILMDYLLFSWEISMKGAYNILFPSEDFSNYDYDYEMYR